MKNCVLKRLYFIVSLFVSIMISGFQSYSCVCIKPSIDMALRSSDLIIVGTPIQEEFVGFDEKGNETVVDFYDTSFADHALARRYLFTVETIVKGKESIDTIFVYSEMTSCGIMFDIGKKYILYATHQPLFTFSSKYKKWKRPIVLSTDYCTRTKLYSEEEIKALEEAKKQK